MANISLQGSYGAYNLYEHEEKYYAVNRNVGEDEIEALIVENKLLEASDKDDLIEKIRTSEDWANSRGMYGGKHDAEANKNALRANSFDMIGETITQNYSKPITLKTPEGLFIVEGKKLDLSKHKFTKRLSLDDLEHYTFVNSTSDGAVPELIFEYNGHNIVEFDKDYYGIPLSAGALNLQETDLSTIEGLIKQKSVKEVMSEIDNTDTHPAETAQPKGGIVKSNYFENPHLIKECDGYNLVGFKDYFYKIDHSSGPLDLSSLSEEELGKFERAKSLESLIDAKRVKSSASDENERERKFIKSWKGYEIFFYEGVYFATPSDAKPLDFENEDIVERPDVLYDPALDAVEELITAEIEK
jgi:hypothetical protein